MNCLAKSPGILLRRFMPKGSGAVVDCDSQDASKQAHEYALATRTALAPRAP